MANSTTVTEALAAIDDDSTEVERVLADEVLRLQSEIKSRVDEIAAVVHANKLREKDKENSHKGLVKELNCERAGRLVLLKRIDQLSYYLSKNKAADDELVVFG